MNHLRAVASVAIALVLSGAAVAQETAHGRQGLTLGFGGGISLISLKPAAVYGSLSDFNDRENKPALSFFFRIGYAPTDVMLLDLSGRFSNLKAKTESADDVTTEYAFVGPRITYFLKQEAPSVFLTGAVGMTVFWGPDEVGGGSFNGYGVRVGAGYEVIPIHGGAYCLEGDVTWACDGSNYSEYVLSASVAFCVMGNIGP